MEEGWKRSEGYENKCIVQESKESAFNDFETVKKILIKLEQCVL